MKEIVKLANKMLAPDKLRAQFSFSSCGYSYWGVVSPIGLWYKGTPSNIESCLLLYPVFKDIDNLDNEKGIIYPTTQEQLDDCYPFDEVKFAKITTDKILGLMCPHKSTGHIRMGDTSDSYWLLERNNVWCNKDNQLYKIYEHSSDYTTRILIPEVLKGVPKTAKDFVIWQDKAAHPVISFKSSQKTNAISCSYALGYARENTTLVVENRQITVSIDNDGTITKEREKEMREKLPGLKILGSTETIAVEPVVIEKPAVQEVVEAVVIQGYSEPTVESALTDMGVNTIPWDQLNAAAAASDSVCVTALPDTEDSVVVANTSTPVELPAEEPVQKVQETVTIPAAPEVEVSTEVVKEAPKEEPVPVTIDTLRYQFTEVKTMVTAFDKALREYAKSGACSKKIQDELEKYKNENSHLREELKRLTKESEQLAKLKKYFETL
jgi:hypothetical protein